jgi:hypothetical protein
LRASFEGLVSVEVWDMARTLFAAERPGHFTRLRNPDRSAMAYALRRLGFHRSLFRGNDMGVHMGVLGTDTLDYLRSGAQRPAGARPLLDWNQVVDVWSRRFLPAPATVGESAKKKNMDDHREARRKRSDRARSFPADRIKVSAKLEDPDPEAPETSLPAIVGSEASQSLANLDLLEDEIQPECAEGSGADAPTDAPP